MSWLSELKWSNTDERIMQMVAGDEELDESVVSTYDRKQGFLYKIAQKIQSGTLPDASEASDGDVLTIDDGEPAWAAPSGGGGGGLVVHRTQGAVGGEDAYILDKTAAEIIAAAKTGYVVLDAYTEAADGNAVMPLSAVFYGTRENALVFSFGVTHTEGEFLATAPTESDYPYKIQPK